MIRAYFFLLFGTYFWSAVSGIILYVIGFFKVEGVLKNITSTFLVTLFFVFLVGNSFLKRKLSEYSPLFLIIFPFPISLIIFLIGVSLSF